MAATRPSTHRRLIPPLLGSYLAAVALALSGCGGNETGTQVSPTEEQKQATNAMADFMKKGSAKAKPRAKAK